MLPGPSRRSVREGSGAQLSSNRAVVGGRCGPSRDSREAGEAHLSGTRAVAGLPVLALPRGRRGAPVRHPRGDGTAVQALPLGTG
ncbi:hypothetical protein [Corallococcus coralloides]|uniref:hypothetical protein n=1 Tax=Corallococcus coralloides TaxID=184914 RepID=UPI000308C9F7|nr:hypothetical protein [Corallococcus coralloides]